MEHTKLLRNLVNPPLTLGRRFTTNLQHQPYDNQLISKTLIFFFFVNIRVQCGGSDFLLFFFKIIISLLFNIRYGAMQHNWEM